MKRKPQRYVPPVKYTPEELLRYEILDLENDLALAEGRDKDNPGMAEYAVELRAKIAELKGDKS